MNNTSGDDNTSIVSKLASIDANRIKGYKELLDFYHGRHWEGNARQREKRLTFNYAKVVIDKITSYLMSGIGFSADPVRVPNGTRLVEDSDDARCKAQQVIGYRDDKYCLVEQVLRWTDFQPQPVQITHR